MPVSDQPSYQLVDTIYAEGQRRMESPADAIYRIIADYTEHHPRILPPAFSDLTVEQGGVGQGTVISFNLKLGGRSKRYRARITEPEPGRVLQETDLDSGAVTTFEVLPEGFGTRVRISTELPKSRGIRGFVERRVVPNMLGNLYAEELTNLDRYAREQTDQIASQRELAHA